MTGAPPETAERDRHRQRRVAGGMALAALWTGVIFWAGPRFAVGADTGPLHLAALAMLGPGLALAAIIGWIAQARFFDARIIDGSAPAPGTRADAALRVLRNTAEQALLAVLVWPALAVMVSPGRLGIIPCLGLNFVLARMLFWAGYAHGAPARSFGFAATFYPTLAAGFWALGLLVAGRGAAAIMP